MTTEPYQQRYQTPPFHMGVSGTSVASQDHTGESVEKKGE